MAGRGSSRLGVSFWDRRRLLHESGTAVVGGAVQPTLLPRRHRASPARHSSDDCSAPCPAGEGRIRRHGRSPSASCARVLHVPVRSGGAVVRGCSQRSRHGVHAGLALRHAPLLRDPGGVGSLGGDVAIAAAVFGRVACCSRRRPRRRCGLGRSAMAPVGRHSMVDVGRSRVARMGRLGLGGARVTGAGFDGRCP